MFTYPRSLDPTYYGGTQGTKVFDLLTHDGSRSTSHVRADALSTPGLLTVSHDSRTVSGKVVKGHLVKHDFSMDAADGTRVTISASIVLKVPVDTDVTEQIVEDTLAIACKASMDAAFTTFVAGEV